LSPNCFRIRGKDAINIAFAGVGTPIKESVWRVSRLNFARRIAEKTGITNAIYAIMSVPKRGIPIIGNVFCFNIIKIIAAGTTPKETTSASESSSFPISLLTCNMRAEKPSKKSNIPAIPIRIEAATRFPLNAATNAKQPEKRFMDVKKLGI
jgi:hypothetical protein